MPKTKQELVESMADLLKEMNPLLEKANLRSPLYIPTNAEGIYKIDILREAYGWLKAIYEIEYKDALRVWNLLPEELWERYRTFGGLSGAEEVKLLNKRMTMLRAVTKISNRPKFFIKKKEKLNEK